MSKAQAATKNHIKFTRTYNKLEKIIWICVCNIQINNVCQYS